MKNREKYAEEIKNYNQRSFCKDFIRPIILGKANCYNQCEQCRMLQRYMCGVVDAQVGTKPICLFGNMPN